MQRIQEGSAGNSGPANGRGARGLRARHTQARVRTKRVLFFALAWTRLFQAFPSLKKPRSLGPSLIRYKRKNLNFKNYQEGLQYLMSLATTLFLPTFLSRSYLPGSSPVSADWMNKKSGRLWKEKFSKRCQKNSRIFFPGLTRRSAPFPMVIKQLLDGSPDRLSQLTEMYNNLVDQGLESSVFNQVLHAVLTIMSGGGLVLSFSCEFWQS